LVDWVHPHKRKVPAGKAGTKPQAEDLLSLRESEALAGPGWQRGIFEKLPGSGVWWIRFVDGRGRYRREKVGAYGMAVKLLAKRRGEAIQGKKLPETLRRKFVSFAEVADDALAYSRAHKRSWQDDESRMKRLKEW
jgi:hypothetical protein